MDRFTGASQGRHHQVILAAGSVIGADTLAVLVARSTSRSVVATMHAPKKLPARYRFELWRDARGRVSWLRILALAFLAFPVAVAVYDGSTIGFGPRPLNDMIHRAGYWALIFLMVSLVITPLRRIARFGKLLDVRRMIGVGAFAYAAAHIMLYVADQMFDLRKVGSEIALRLYLTIGFVALIGLALLAATSTDNMVRRLGARPWQRLHQAIYVIALLALIHFFQQTKADVWLPTFVAGLFTWLMGYRLLVRLKKRRGELPTWMLALLTLVVAALVFIGEAIGIGIAFNVSPLLVLQTALDFDLETIRPGWGVLLAGLCVVVINLVRSRLARVAQAGQCCAFRPSC
jgi:sulfoxide reductase heme-binding subunit YedZ